MGLTRRKDSYYVEFRVLDNGESLKLASGGGGHLKRWKVGSLNRTMAQRPSCLWARFLVLGKLVRSL